MSNRPRLVVWFSCGAASAVTVKLCQAKYAATHDIAIVRCIVADEDADNWRFAADCEAWFGEVVRTTQSLDYASADAVWRVRRYMSGVHGAPCTDEMKKEPRRQFEREWNPDIQAFGFTAEEVKRDAMKFAAVNKLLKPQIA